MNNESKKFIYSMINQLFKWLFLSLIISGILIIGLVVFVLFDYQSFYKNAFLTNATIINISNDTSEKDSITISFISNENKSVLATVSADKDEYKITDKIKIIHNIKNPKEIRIYYENYESDLITVIIISIILTITGIIGTIFVNRKKWLTNASSR